MPRSVKQTKINKTKATGPKIRIKVIKKIKKVAPGKAVEIKIDKTDKTLKPKDKPSPAAKIVLESINKEMLPAPVSSFLPNRTADKVLPDKIEPDKSYLGGNNEFAPAKIIDNKSDENQAILNKETVNENNEQVVDRANSTIIRGRSLGLYRKIAFSFIILTVILLAAVFYFSFVKVAIILIPNQERISSNLIIDIFNQDNRSATNKSEILGIVQQDKVEQSKTYSATGIEVVSQEITGKVNLINNHNQNQPLVATTRLLSSDNKLFRIKDTVNVPAGGQIEVEVYADEFGQEMIIGPAHFTIPGLWAGLQDKIYGESQEPMEHSRQIKKYIMQTDIDQAIQELRQSLLEKAKIAIGENYQDYDQVIYDIDNNSISQQVDGQAGEEKEEFSISAEALVTIVAFNEDEIYRLAQQKLASVLPDDKELIGFSKDEIDYSLNNYNTNQGMASLNVNFTGKMIIKEGASIIEREKLVGLSRQQLSDYLKGLSGIAGYEIKFYPSFIKKVPNLIDRIELEVRR